MSSESGRGPVRQNINISIEKFDEDVRPFIRDLVNKANESLFSWKTFPIYLPETIAGSITNEDLFVLSNTFETTIDFSPAESRTIRPTRFTKEQLNELWRTGEFQVESEQNPGQCERWILNQGLVKGTEKISTSFNNDIARAFVYLTIKTPQCIYSETFSLAQGLNGIWNGLVTLLDMLIGLPEFTHESVEVPLRKERAKYLVSELQSPDVESLQVLADWAANHKTDTSSPPVRVIQQFKTETGLNIDLALCSKEIVSASKSEIQRILASSLEGWIPTRMREIRSRLIASFEPSIRNDIEIESAIKNEIKVQYLDRVCANILNDDALKRIDIVLPQLLVNQVKTYSALKNARDKYSSEFAVHMQETEKSLRLKNPSLSQTTDWLPGKLDTARKAYISAHKWDVHHNAIEVCQSSHLDQSAYFLQRDLIFRRDMEQKIKRKLEVLDEKPALKFKFKERILLPRNYIIKKISQPGVIPTVISYNENELASHTVNYSIDKYRKHSNSSRYPFWRWTNFAMRTWVWLWNILFWLTVTIPWNSRCSLRALFCLEPFTDEYEVNPRTKHLRKSGGKIKPMIFRLRMRWRGIFQDLDAFEKSSDTGILPKGLTRIIKYTHNYLFKGLIGTIIVFMFMVTTCTIISTLSLLLAIAAPIVVPVVSLVFHIVFSLLYDFERKSAMSAIFWSIVANVALIGFAQIFISLLLFALYPTLVVILLPLACIRRVLRHCWDVLVFAIIKNLVRIPKRDDFLAHRISNSAVQNSVTRNSVYQIHPDQALFGIHLLMEREQLEKYSEKTKQQILLPENECDRFMKKYFLPFGFKLDQPFEKIHSKSQFFLQQLNALVETRLLKTPKFPSMFRFRLTEDDLLQVLQHGAFITKQFYTDKMFPEMSQQEQTQFWKKLGLSANDWLGLCANRLIKTFSPDILIPLEPDDKTNIIQTQYRRLPSFVSTPLDPHWLEDLNPSKIIKPKTSALEPFRSFKLDEYKLPVDAFNPMAYKIPKDRDNAEPTGFGAYIYNLKWSLFKFSPPNQTLVQKLDNPLPQVSPLEVCLLIHSKKENQN